MKLLRLEATDFRNFEHFSCLPASSLNILYGANGSGKTSVLEAIYLLSLGRSFRSNNVQHVIRHPAASLSVFAELVDDQNSQSAAGIQRQRNGEVQIRLNGVSIHTLAELTEQLPVQLLHQNSFELLTGGPKNRRHFMDWGVFHHGPEFFPLWKRFSRLLAQRNAAIRQQLPMSQIKYWDSDLAAVSERLDQLRQEYLDIFWQQFTAMIPSQLGFELINLRYHRGWDEKRDLMTVFSESFARDMALGYTQHGPHRADLSFRANNLPAAEVLSRGNQKMLVCALSLAQGRLLKQHRGKNCVYLIDDLAAELDSDRRNFLIDMLLQLNSQVFIAVIEQQSLQDIFSVSSYKMFHVKQNQLEEQT